MVKSPALAIWSCRPGIKDTWRQPQIEKEFAAIPTRRWSGWRMQGPRQLSDLACPKVRRRVLVHLLHSISALRPNPPSPFRSAFFCIAQLRKSHIDYIVDLTYSVLNEIGQGRIRRALHTVDPFTPPLRTEALMRLSSGLFLSACVASLCLSGCSEEETAAPTAPRPARVVVVTPHKLALVAQGAGRIQSRYVSQVGFEVGGRRRLARCRHGRHRQEGPEARGAQRRRLPEQGDRRRGRPRCSQGRA